MMTPEPSQKIVHACRLLFTDPHLVDHRFLHNMAEEDLKSAFRKKALQTHPDRFRALGRSHEELSQLFQEVFAAYETVQEFLARRHTPASSRGRHPAEGEKTAAAAAGRPAPADHYYRGGLPGRELRLGEFLYYSGRISWRTLIAAIVWQKRQRPLFGEIARQWNFLSAEEVRWILSCKSWHEKFGECARRHGLLSSYQQMAVTGRQKRLQPLIGTHFVENGLLSAERLNIFVNEMAQHNLQVG